MPKVVFREWFTFLSLRISSNRKSDKFHIEFSWNLILSSSRGKRIRVDDVKFWEERLLCYFPGSTNCRCLNDFSVSVTPAFSSYTLMLFPATGTLHMLLLEYSPCSLYLVYCYSSDLLGKLFKCLNVPLLIIVYFIFVILIDECLTCR